MTTEVKDYLDVSVVWEKGADPEYPYHAEIEGEPCLVRLNDFPAEHLYTLLAGSVAIADFDDWPANWVRPEMELQTETTYFALESGLSSNLRKIAVQRGVAPETLLNLWVQERLQEEGELVRVE